MIEKRNSEAIRSGYVSAYKMGRRMSVTEI